MNHRIGRVVFATLVGAAVAIASFQWITSPETRSARAEEEQAVRVSRSLLATATGIDGLEIVDPLEPNRKVGKVYVYAEEPGWAVSGYYRRDDNDRWHPYLLTMSEGLELFTLKVQDKALADLPNRDPKIVVTN